MGSIQLCLVETCASFNSVTDMRKVQDQGKRFITMKIQDLCEPATESEMELVIDLSNICRNRSLVSSGEVARWDRILKVLEIWNSKFPHFKKPKVRMVADKNLRFKFVNRDLAQFKEAVRLGYVIETEKADPVLLDLAESFNCLILSNDNYVGYQAERPWIHDPQQKRFVQIRVDGSEIFLNEVIHLERTGFSKSRAEEKDRLKNNRIDLNNDAKSDLLKSIFRCDNRNCIRRAILPEGAISTPERGSDNTAICPGCHEPLTRVGESSKTVVLKLTDKKSKRVLRIPLEVGRELVLGRVASDLSLAEVLKEPELARVSRTHAKVGFNGKQLYFEDLGSSNGSTIAYWEPGPLKLSIEQRIDKNQRIVINPRDLIVLAGVLEIQRSGRRYPFDLAQPGSKANAIGENPKTILLNRD